MVREMSLVSIGIAAIVIGFALVVIGMLLHSGGQQKTGSSNAKFSFVGFIGPFPFGFGNDKQLVATALAIAIVLFLVIMLLFSRGLRWP